MCPAGVDFTLNIFKDILQAGLTFGEIGLARKSFWQELFIFVGKGDFGGEFVGCEKTGWVCLYGITFRVKYFAPKYLTIGKCRATM